MARKGFPQHQTIYSSGGQVSVGQVAGRHIINVWKDGSFSSRPGSDASHRFGSDKVVTQVRPLNGTYERIETSGFVCVEWSEGKECTAVVSGDDNLIDLVELSLVGNTLRVGTRQNVNFTSHNLIKVALTSPTMEAVHQSGSGDVQLRWLRQNGLQVVMQGSGDLDLSGQVRDLQLTLQGSGDMDAVIDSASKISVDLHGSGDVSISGRTDLCVLRLAGSGDIQAQSLKAAVANIDLLGSGDIDAFASDEAQVRLFGNGDISVRGRPSKRSSECHGSGDINFI